MPWRARRMHLLQLGLVALLIALFIALGLVVRTGRTLAFDERAHRLVRGPVPTAYEADDTSFRTRFMYLGPDIGTATVLFVPLTALVLWHQRRRHAAALIVISAAGALVLTYFLKIVFQRARYEDVCCLPLTPGPTIFDYLFPSTHTLLSVVTYGLIAALVMRLFSGWRRALPALFVIVLVAFVGVSLVYLDTHYLTDVIGGLLLGGAWLIISLHILRRID
jgi:membrane-associated phospholipid phosphatase